MKTQAVQVNEKNKEERQISGHGLNRPDHPRNIEEECLQKEPFSVNHFYSYPGRTMLLPTAWYDW